VLAHESGMTAPVDPLGGSYYVESLTDELEQRVHAELAEIDRRGGTLAALTEEYQQGEIAQAAYEFQRAVEDGSSVIVGVNAFADEGDELRPAPQAIDAEAERQQVERTHAVRAGRNQEAADLALATLTDAARGTVNVLPRILACVEAHVTLGEISDALRDAWGEHRP
jgi:methylmalonyl-CoA mutase N-terminal domain/subunit